ncbi:hypothetical protein NPIL_223171 [Nephila pilipes]|uniref:Uncharacterized protein n=1 Tax=Nephila pilipes TaxID=299642 RepID=A0A8X6MH41_NEPPI|nr:hypothetical protein NPIL_223171 [Nephila pilipes]
MQGGSGRNPRSVIPKLPFPFQHLENAFLRDITGVVEGPWIFSWNCLVITLARDCSKFVVSPPRKGMDSRLACGKSYFSFHIRKDIGTGIKLDLSYFKYGEGFVRFV